MPAPPTVTNSPTPPTAPADGDLWFNVLTGREYVWYIGPSGVGTWVQTQPSGSAVVTQRPAGVVPPQPPAATPQDATRVPTLTVSPVPPSSPQVGDLWWSPITGMECVWYDDGNTKQWVQTQPVKYINLATLAGPAGGDLTGMYPNPQIVPGVVMEEPQIAALPDPALDDLHLVPAEWVQDRIAGLVGVPIPPKSIAYGDTDGSLKGDATLLQYDETTKTLTVSGGDVAIRTLPPATSDTRAATTAFVGAAITLLNIGQYAPLASPTFTGDPKAPTPATADNDTSIATTAFVRSAISTYSPPPDLSGYAPLASPTFTGDPKAPTPATADNDTSIATTAFVRSAISTYSPPPDLSGYAPLASPTFTGDPKAPTPATADNDTSIATTAFVKAQGYLTSVPATYAPLASPTFTGDPKAPTPIAGDNDTSIATTAFVTGAIAAIPPPNLSAYAPLASPTFTGDPQAPTPATADNDTSVATTAFVKAAIAATPATSISVSDTAPGSPSANALWWNSALGQLFLWFNDGSSTQWVPASPAAAPVVPTGTIMDFAGSTSPAGWYLCDGSAKSRTTDAALFSVISTTYGAGDGSTTFNLPDLRGRVTTGVDSGSVRLSGYSTVGAVGGEQFHTLTVAELANHTHTAIPGYSVLIANAGVLFCHDGGGSAYIGYTGGGTDGTGGNGGHNTMQPTMAINKIIKA